MTTAQAIFMAALIVLAAGLMVAAYYLKQRPLAFAAAGGWLFFAVFCYMLSTGPWDIYYGMFFFGMAMLIISALEPALMRQQSDLGSSVVDELDDDKELDEYDRDYKRHIKRLKTRHIKGGVKKRSMKV